MDKKNARARKQLKQIGTVKDFEELLQALMLSEEEKRLLRLHYKYKEKKSLQYIADVMCMSEANVKKIHRKILSKVSELF